jgi:hypothetical protein
MAEDTFLEGLNEKQLKDYSQYLKLPNMKKEIAKGLAIGEIDAAQAKDMMFGAGLEISAPDVGKEISNESYRIIQGINVDSVQAGLELTKAILKENKLLEANELKLPDGTIVIPEQGVDAAGESLKPQSLGTLKITQAMQKEYEVYLPYKVKLLLNGFNVDEGAPEDVRWKLQFSAEDQLYQLSNFRDLMINHFVDEKIFSRNDYAKNPNNFEVAIKKLKPFDKDVMSWRILPDLGGDGIWRSINPPGLDYGDIKSFTSTTGLEMVSTTTAYIIGASLGFFRGQPIHSGAINAGAMRYLHEVANELVGKHFLELPHAKDLNEIMWANIPEGVIEYLGGGIIMKSLQKASQFLKASKDKMNVTKIIDTAKDYKGANPKVTQILDDAKKLMTKKWDISADEASKYLASAMALQFPDLVIGYTSKVSKKGIKESIENLIKKENVIFNVESQIVKKIVGADVRLIDSFKALDDAMTKIVAADDASKIYIQNAGIALKKDIISALSGTIKSSPNVKYIDSFAFPISEISAKLAAVESATSKSITSIYRKNATNDLYNIKFGNTINLKQNMGAFRNILGGDPKKLIKFLTPEKPIRKNFTTDREFKRAMADYTTTLSAVENLGLNAFNKGHQVLKNYLKLGKNKAGTLSYENANMLLNVVRDLESVAIEGTQKNFLRKFKGVLNQAIMDSVIATDNKVLIGLVNQSNHLVYLRQASGVNEFARAFGYGTHILSPSKVAATYEGSNVFYKFFDGKNAIRDSKILGDLLENNPYWKMNKKTAFQIRGAAMEFYLDKVVKSGPLSSKMGHSEFMGLYGKQMESILGTKLFAKFGKSAQRAEMAYKDFVKDYDINMGIIQKYLQLGGNLREYTAEEMGRAIIRQGNTLRLGPVIKALGGVSSQEWKAVQRVLVTDMFRNTSTISPITNEMSFNGVMLAQYLSKNQGLLRHAFGKEFIKDHQLLAKALIVLQNNTKETMKKLGNMDPIYKTLAEQTQSGGMMIDIFYGPLNHNRLIVNRLSRLYDKFDLDGVTHSYLNDYQLWIKTAKQNFLSGQYPVILDKMANREKVTWAETVFKYHVGFDTFGKPSIVTLGAGSQALTEIDLLNSEISIGDFTIQKHRAPIPGEATVAGGIEYGTKFTGEALKKVIWDPVTNFVTNLVKNINEQSEVVKTPEIKEVEKKLKQMAHEQ